MVARTTESALVEEVHALRDAVAELRALVAGRPRLRLRVSHGAAFIGGPVTCTVTARAGDGGAALIGVPVTFTTSWGRLRVVEGIDVRAGAAVTARTDSTGTARAVLLPPTATEPTAEQQAALDAMLGRLDPAAPGPAAAEAGLRELAREYQWQANSDFRRAVDRLFREIRPDLLEPGDRMAPASIWPVTDATVVAFAGGGAADDSDPEEASAVEAAASAVVRFKDWLGAWLEALLAVTEAEGALTKQLAHARDVGGEPAILLDRLYSGVNDFVDGRRGVVAAVVGRTVAEAALRRFVERELTDLPAATRAAVTPALLTASRTVRTDGVGVLAAVQQTGAQARQHVAEAIGKVTLPDLGPFTDRLDRVDAALAGKIDAAALTSKVDTRDFRAALDAKADSAALEAMQVGLSAAIDGKVDQRELAEFNQAVEGRFREQDTRMVRIETRLPNLIDRPALADAVAVKANVDRVNGLERDVTTALAAKADRQELTTVEAQVAEQLRRKADNEELTRVTGELRTALRRKVEATDFNAFSSDVLRRLPR